MNGFRRFVIQSKTLHRSYIWIFSLKNEKKNKNRAFKFTVILKTFQNSKTLQFLDNKAQRQNESFTTENNLKERRSRSNVIRGHTLEKKKHTNEISFVAPWLQFGLK